MDFKRFPHFKQQDHMDCGATCLRIVSKYYGRNIPIQQLRRFSQVTKSGVNLLGISEAAEKIGFRTQGLRLDLDHIQKISLPAILHWGQNHFVVLYAVKKGKYYISDPGKTKVVFSESEFLKGWYSHQALKTGTLLILSPTPEFYRQKDLEIDNESPGLKWGAILRYFYEYRRLFVQLIIGFLVGTILQLFAPFLTQSIVDIGISTHNLNFIHLVLIAQIALFMGQLGVSFIRSWILLHISTRVNISILTDMLIKLMKLPMVFFETKTTGDIMQRMNDQQRIESFLTGSTLSTVFSLVNLIVFGFLLAFYHAGIFLVFMISTILYTGWILLFLKRRRELDNRRFAIGSDNQTTIVELVGAMHEIKLNNSEKQKRWIWEGIQARLFQFKVKSLALSQYQQSGSMAINQLKGIFITFLSAKAVVDGHLTLGSMMAIQYIVGMVNSPVEQLLGFIQSYQDAKISLERINEIYEEADEEPVDRDWLRELPFEKSIFVDQLTFRYPGAGNEPVLKNINLIFPEGKTTAIVGMSGSGKTTLLKMILRYFESEKGEIKIGSTPLSRIGFSTWRDACGVVMQDGFIFADTIENNIAVGQNYPDPERIERALKIANLHDFIKEQPFGLKTKIGTAGKGVSQGQKQRLLIARAVYKNPDYILFDEATNALDANNERIIIDHLSDFFEKRTAIIVAHRLSTVSHADNIIVMDKGEVVEQGTHSELVAKRGFYYELVKNQLELGN